MSGGSCVHPDGRASGMLKILSFIVCDDCGELVRFLPRQGVDYGPLARMITDVTVRGIDLSAKHTGITRHEGVD